MSDALVIIPTYNEIENISAMLDAVMALKQGFDVLVIDDASPDGTADCVRKKQIEYPGRIFLETRAGKLGLGTAYIHGFKYALARGYDYIIEMDAVFSGLTASADLPHYYRSHRTVMVCNQYHIL